MALKNFSKLRHQTKLRNQNELSSLLIQQKSVYPFTIQKSAKWNAIIAMKVLKIESFGRLIFSPNIEWTPTFARSVRMCRFQLVVSSKSICFKSTLNIMKWLLWKQNGRVIFLTVHMLGKLDAISGHTKEIIELRNHSNAINVIILLNKVPISKFTRNWF